MSHQATRRYSPYENRRRNLVWTNDGKNGSDSNVQRRNWRWSREPTKPRDCVCKFWKSGNCNRGDQCHFLHSWSSVPGSVLVTSLDGHDTGLKGIALPSGSDKLFSASSDGTLRIWDCHTAHCVSTINLQEEPGCLMGIGPWAFLGLPNAVKAFNVQTNQDVHLGGVVVGQVNAITTTLADDMVFAGTSSGSISVWKAGDSESAHPFTYLTSLKAHSAPVTSLVVGGVRLYSASVDRTIKVWDLKTFKCTMTLRRHTHTVTSLICWDQVLLSSSLDGTINVWGFTEDTSCLKVLYTRRQEQSVHSLSGMNDADGKPILFCSHQDGAITLYHLPSFEERGKMFSTGTASSMSIGPQGLFFTGDKSGQLRVWNLAASKA